MNGLFGIDSEIFTGDIYTAPHSIVSQSTLYLMEKQIASRDRVQNKHNYIYFRKSLCLRMETSFSPLLLR